MLISDITHKNNRHEMITMNSGSCWLLNRWHKMGNVKVISHGSVLINLQWRHRGGRGVLMKQWFRNPGNWSTNRSAEVYEL